MKFDIVRAWKDETYHQSLSEEQRELLPANPAGEVELSEAELQAAFGAGNFGLGPFGPFGFGLGCFFPGGFGHGNFNRVAISRSCSHNCSFSCNIHQDFY